MIGVCVYRNREFVLATISYKSFVARSPSLFLNGPWPFRLCVYFRMFIPHRSLSCRLYGILFFSHGSYSWRPSVRLLFLDISPMSSGTENTCQFFQDSVSLLFFLKLFLKICQIVLYRLHLTPLYLQREGFRCLWSYSYSFDVSTYKFHFLHPSFISEVCLWRSNGGDTPQLPLIPWVSPGYSNYLLGRIIKHRLIDPLV